MIPEVILAFIDMLLLTDVFGDALEDSGDGNFSKVSFTSPVLTSKDYQCSLSK